MAKPLRRVALCCGCLVRAGLERVVCDLAIGCKERGLEITVIAFLGGQLSGELREAGVDVQILFAADSESYRPNLVRSLFGALKMARVLRARRIEAMNVHGLGAHRIALLAARIARVPVKTFVFHSNYPVLQSGSSSELGRVRRELAPFDHHIAITSRIAELVVKAGAALASRLTVIENGIRLSTGRAIRDRDTLRLELGFAEDDRLVILVARFDPAKNHCVAIESMSEVVRRNRHIQLLLVGRGPAEVDARALTRELGLEARVHFLGFREDVADLLGASDLFLLPSDYEGLPISLLEAMASGLPSVVSDAPGITDTVEAAPGCARLVAPRDAAALARAIVEACEDPTWLAEAGAKAELLVRQRFDARVMVERYHKLHQRLLDGRCSDG